MNNIDIFILFELFVGCFMILGITIGTWLDKRETKKQTYTDETYLQQLNCGGVNRVGHCNNCQCGKKEWENVYSKE